MLRLSGLLVACLALNLSAQTYIPTCTFAPVDDGFELGCCAIPTLTLPQPPSITFNADWGVYNGCSFQASVAAQITLSAPVWILCDIAVIPVTINGPMGLTNGVLLGKYVRTWMEPDASGQVTNVWRFLINGDIPFVPNAAFQAGPWLPPVTGAPWNLTAHMVGHLDYSCSSTTAGNNWEAAVSLSHLPGCIQHGPFSSNAIPALATSTASYHLVGPSPFTFAPVLVPQGPLRGDSARVSTVFTIPFSYTCHGETDFGTGGFIGTTNSDCFCNTGPGLWEHQSLFATTNCASFTQTYTSIPIPGTPLASTGFAAMPLGFYGSGAIFPQNRELVIYFGVLSNFSALACGPVAFPFHIVTGVATTSSFPGTLFNIPGTVPVSSNTFLDLQNMLPLVYFPGGGLPTPGYGSYFGSDLVWSFNF